MLKGGGLVSPCRGFLLLKGKKRRKFLAHWTSTAPYEGFFFKFYLLCQIALFVVQTSPGVFFLHTVHTILQCFFFLNFILRFLTIFFSKFSNSPLYPMEKPKTSIIQKMSDHTAKQSKIWDSGVVYGGICATLELWPIAKFSCPNMAIFFKSAHISQTAARRSKISSVTAPWGRKRLCATSESLANCQVSCPNIAILKISPYLVNCCPYSKNKLNFDPLGRKRVYVQLL